MFKKLLVVIFISIFCGACKAGQNEILSIAHSNYNDSVTELERREASCKKMEIVLPKDTFKNIELNQDELKKAVKYFYFKSQVACSRENVEKYLVASAVLASLSNEKHSAEINSANDLIVKTYIQLLKAENDYQNISEKKRKDLSLIKQLKTPFKLIASIDSLGLN